MKTFRLELGSPLLNLTLWSVVFTNLGLCSPALSAPPKKKARLENTSSALSSNPTPASFLPSEVQLQILNYLGAEDIAQCKGVSQDWKECIENSPTFKTTVESGRDLITLLRTHQRDPILRNLLTSITYGLSGTNLGKMGARSSRISHSLNRLFNEILDQAIAKSIPNFRQIPGLIAANETIDPELADRLFRFACDCQDPPVQFFTFLGLASNPAVSSEILTEIRSYLTPEKFSSTLEPWLDLLDAEENPQVSHHIFSEDFENTAHTSLSLAPFIGLLPPAGPNEENEDVEIFQPNGTMAMLEHIEELKIFIFTALIEHPKYEDPTMISTALDASEEIDSEFAKSTLFNTIASSSKLNQADLKTLLDLSSALVKPRHRTMVLLLVVNNPGVSREDRKSALALLTGTPFTVMMSSFLNTKVLRQIPFENAKYLYISLQRNPNLFHRFRHPFEIQMSATGPLKAAIPVPRALSRTPTFFLNSALGRALNPRPLTWPKSPMDQIIRLSSRFPNERFAALLVTLPRNPGFSEGSLPTIFQTAQNLPLAEKAEVLSVLASSNSKGKTEKSPLLAFIEKCSHFD